MRLMNTSTILLEEFIDDDAPPYAILSHTWGKDEVVFDDITNDRPGYKNKAGYGKIEKTCQIAKRYGIKYAWVDTCCIDKSSSSELSQSINSMFRWYREAQVCYAFLADLDAKGGKPEELLPACRWFSRGWTLQELIAPSKIYFYDKDWVCRGTRQNMASILAKITKIDLGVLEQWSGKLSLSHIPVARKMSWAAHREVTRLEDQAYSLLGIFDVNMPLLYGEREQAFIRLQEEIIRQQNDLSILAWIKPDSPKFSGVLAPSPSAFEHAADLVFYREPTSNPEFSMTNKGLRINIGVKIEDENHLLPLSCAHKGIKLTELAVPLVMYQPGIYARQSPEKLRSAGRWQRSVERHHQRYLTKSIPATLDVALARERLRQGAFKFDFQLHKHYYIHYEASKEARLWDPDNMMYYRDFPYSDFAGQHLFTLTGRDGGDQFLLLFGLHKLKPWASLASRRSHGRGFEALVEAFYDMALSDSRDNDLLVFNITIGAQPMRLRFKVSLMTDKVGDYETHLVTLACGSSSANN